LDDEVGTHRPAVGLVQEFGEDLRGEAERWIGHHSVWLPRQAEMAQIGPDHPDVVRGRCCLESVTQSLDPFVVDFDGPHVGVVVEKRSGDCAGAGSEVDDEFGWTNVEVVDDLGEELTVSQEVLAECASSPVALGRSPPGHGASQSSS